MFNFPYFNATFFSFSIININFHKLSEEKMATYSSIIFTLLLSIISTFIYIQHSAQKQRMVLQQLEYYVKSGYKEQIMKSVMKEVVPIVTEEMLPSLMNEIKQVFLPEQLEDNKLKEDFVQGMAHDIQTNITITVRKFLEGDMKSIAKEVITKGDQGKEVKTYPQNLCRSDKKLPPHQKVLSYTVFGTKKKYYEGIPEVLKEAAASNLYHDWHVRIYHDALITPDIIAKYKMYKNLDFCDVRKLPRYGDITNIFGMFWRFIPLGDENVDVMCSRDLDSSLLTREEDAVGEFLKSGKLVHSMRDNPAHGIGMLGGMWCLRVMDNRMLANNSLETILKRAKASKTRNDQPILNAVIWDRIDKQKYVMQHDSFLCQSYRGSIPFPTRRKDNTEFVGCPQHICNGKLPKCYKGCRPRNHQDWEYC